MEISELTLVTVGLGEIRVSRNPQDVLVAYGLGSCLGLGAYDPAVRVAGLMHAILPQAPPAENGQDEAPAKYVDRGFLCLLGMMRHAGADPARLIVRLAGGANILNAPALKMALNIGERNIAAAYDVLAAHHLTPQAQAIGGSMGRTIRLYVSDGRMTVRVMGGQENNL